MIYSNRLINRIQIQIDEENQQSTSLNIFKSRFVHLLESIEAYDETLLFKLKNLFC